MCHRLEHLEREIAYMKGKESTEAALGRLAAENAELRAIIGDLKVDLKMCHKIDGEVLLRPNHLAQTYIPESRVLSSHPPVVIEEEHRRRECGRNNP